MVITKRITLGGIFFETKVVAVIDISKVSRKVEEMSYLYNKNMKIIGRNLDEKQRQPMSVVGMRGSFLVLVFIVLVKEKVNRAEYKKQM